MSGTIAVINDTTALTKPIENVISGYFNNSWVFLFILIVLTVLAFLAIIFKGKFSLKLPGGAGLDVGSDPESGKKVSKENSKNDKSNQPVLTKHIAPHATCKYMVDFKHVVNRTTYTVSRISEIKFKGCLDEQMNYVYEQFINIRTMYQKSYLDTLREKLKDKNEELNDEFCYEDYRYYQAIVKLMLHDMESVIRASFMNNHLTSYSQIDYQGYIELKYNVLKSIESDFIDTMYIGDWVLSREEIFELHRKNRSIFRDLVFDIYLRAQKISEMKQKEIERLEEEHQEFLNITVSGDIKVEKI